MAEMFEPGRKPETAEKPQKERQQQITTQGRVAKENKLFKKFFAQDMKTVTSNVVNDVIIPGIVGLVVSTLKRGVDYLFFGKSTPDARVNDGRYYSSVSTPYVNSKAITYEGAAKPIARTTNNVYTVTSYEFFSEQEAVDTLVRLQELITKFKSASVLDFYDLVGIRPSSVDDSWGWKDLSTAQIEYRGTKVVDGVVRDIFRIKFPRVVPIE